MNIFGFIALVGWFFATVALFWSLPGRRATLISYIAGWLFLPCAVIRFPGVPDYDKAGAISYGCMIGVLLFDSARLMSFRFRLIDMPIVILCICPFFSSLSNDLGFYDGASATFAQILGWGVPYLLGRLYFSDDVGLKELAIAIFIGGLVYVPLCLFEIKMSPRLHQAVYGFQQHSFGQTKRFGGYRPMVFMQHGLMLGLWMSAASLAGAVLWVQGRMKRIRGFPMLLWLLLLYLTALLCKSTGAIVLLILGTLILVASRRMWGGVLHFIVLLVPILYMAARFTGTWSGHSAVSLAADFSDQRAGSLSFRMENEDLLVQHAQQRPLLGWGGWSRSHVFTDNHKDMTVVDGLWVATLGQHGLIGLVALTTIILLPLLLWLRVPVATRTLPALAGAQAIAIFLPLYMIDNLANAMVNPIYTLAAGGLVALAARLPKRTTANVIRQVRVNNEFRRIKKRIPDEDGIV